MRHAYTVAQLQADIASASPPVVLDVRRATTFQQADDIITGALWRDPERVEEWVGSLDPARRIVVYCAHGHQVSQGCCLKLRELGLEAAFLEGGIESRVSNGGRTAAKPGAST